MVLSLVALTVLAGAALFGVYFVDHLIGGIHRVHVHSLAPKPAGGSGLTILLTGAQTIPAGKKTVVFKESGLIMLLHIDASKEAGGVVSIPPQIEVAVPGHGQMQLWKALVVGGPDLLVQAVHSLTGVQISHYAQVDFRHVADTINAIGGVTVMLPEKTASSGYVLHKGANQLNGTTAVYYVRQPSLTEEGRVLRQQSLVRAVLDKLAAEQLLTKPVIAVRVLSALTSMLTVDGTFTTAEVRQLARELGSLAGRDGTFVTAPVRQSKGALRLVPPSGQLWSAITHGSIAAFAREYPATVTPAAPR